MRRRGPARLGAAILALGVGVVAWQAAQQTAPAPARAKGLPPPLSAAPPPPPTSLPGPVAAADARARAPAAVHAVPDPTAGWSFDTTPLRPGEVEFCGVGRAAAESPVAKALEQQANDQVAAAAERLFAVMERSPDPLTRAAAMLARDERDALAEAARRTSDATIYAMAMQACGRAGTQPRSPSCAALGASQMARLDADNVVPWLAVSVEATQRNDSLVVAEAVHRASLAQASRAREFLFADLALSALPADWPPRDAMLASAKVLEIHAALMLPSYLAVFQYCAKERMQDANAQQTCDRLARVLIERGDTLIDYGLGRRLGERAGWPAELVELHDARFEAYRRTLADGDTLASNVATAAGCQALGRGVRLAFAHARQGERAHVQSEVQRSGLSDAALLERHRADLKQRPPAPVASAPR